MMKKVIGFILLSGIFLPNTNFAQCSGTVLSLTASTPSISGTNGTWTVPTGGPYKIKITARGAKGGNSASSFPANGGAGAIIIGNFILNSNQTIEAIAGALGNTGSGNGSGGGGGGSGAQLQGATTPMIIAGGGGGSAPGSNGSQPAGGIHGTTVTGNGQGGNAASGSGGGGYYSAGGNAQLTLGGGAGFNASGGNNYIIGGGGFGGGASSYPGSGGGGGGGYTGGVGGCCGNSFGGGGGSINYGSNQSNTTGGNSAGGNLIIECLGRATFNVTATANQPTCANPQGSLSIDLTGDIDGNTSGGVEYAIVSGSSFSGSPTFSGITADPFNVTTGTGTSAGTYTLRVRLKYNPTIFIDYVYTINPKLTGIIYVNALALGANSGTSWTNAFTDLQTALAAACSGSEIWVAAGTYKPHTSDRNVSFNMLPNVKIYGGFPNTGNPAMADRNWNTNKTILSGDLSGNDIITGSGASLNIANNGENSYHVILNVNNGLNTSNSLLDGFIIKGGNANDFIDRIINGETINDYSGGGIFLYKSAPSLLNLRIEGCYANSGGGIYTWALSPSLNNIIFSNNLAINGGGMNASLSSPKLTNVVFYGNSAYLNGGAIQHSQSLSTLYNVAFIRNHASSNGGGIHNITNASPVLVNTTFWKNSATAEGGGIFNDNSQPIIRNSIFWENTSNSSTTTVGVDITNINNSSATITNSMLQLVNNSYNTGNNLFAKDPLFKNISSPIGADEIFGTNDDGLILSACSPLINAGLNGYNINTTDLAGNPRIFNTTIDMGAYETQSLPPTRLYVNASATGANTGLSWSDAFTDLQSALNYSCKTNLTEIWVAKGTYKPTSTSNQNISFSLVNGVSIYGGFDGTETQRSQRNWTTNVTTLSGLISQNTFTNSVHVVYIGSGITSSTELDGFTISGGTTYSTIGVENFNKRYGGGMFIDGSSSPTIKNCIFKGNFAGNGANGSAIAILGGAQSSSPIIQNCLFYQNSNEIGTNTLYCQDNVQASIINCTFYIEREESYSISCSNIPTISVKNSIFYGTETGGISLSPIFLSNSTLTISNSLIKGGISGISTSNSTINTNGNIFSDAPLFTNVDIGNFTLQACSPAINTGDNAANTGTTDLAGNTRIFNTTIDMGAYEFQSAAVTAPTGVSISATTACEGTSVNLTATCQSGNTVVWYNAATGGTSIGSGSPFSYSTPVGSNQTFYASCVNSCETARMATSNTLTVNAKPSKPTIVTPIEKVVCSPSNLTLSVSGCGGTVTWSEGGATGTSLTLSTVGTYSVSATCTVNACTSDVSDLVTGLEIKAKPSVPTITPLSQLVVCSPSTLELTASCQTGNVVWSTGATTTSLTLNTVGTYAISAKCTLNGCDSDQSSTTNLEIKAKPSVPTITLPSQLVVCSPSTLELTAICQTGNVVWTTGVTSTSLTLNTVGTYAISAKCTLNGCDSDQSSVTNLEIKAKPSVPSITPPSQLAICSPSTLELTATCTTGNVIWSTGATSTSLTLNTVGTYAISAKCTLNGCDSDQSSVTNLEIKAKPSVPTITPPSQLVVCSPSTLELTASCQTGNVVWSTGATGISLTLNSVGTYAISAKCTLNGCDSDQSSTTNLEIKAKPSVPTITPPSQLVVCSPTTLTLTASCASGNVIWSDNSTGTSLTLSAVGTHSILAKCTLNGCDSDPSSATNLEIKAKPGVPTITPPTQLVVCSPSSLELTAACTTGNVVWSTGATTTSLTLNTVGTYSISAKCTLNGCDSDPSSATNLEIKAKPSVPTITPPSQLVVCSPTTLTLTASCASGNIIWSDNSTGTSLTLSAVGTHSISAKCTLNGCDSDQSSTTNLEIKAKPSVPTITPPSQLVVCSPTTLTLTASCASGNVIWSDNSTGTSLTLSAVGTHSISAKCTLNGCDSDQSSTTNLEIKAKPSIPTITPPSQLVVCSPSTLELTASCQTGNVVWSTGATSTSLTLNIVGTYSISAKCTLNGGMPPSCDSDQSSVTNLEIKAKPSVPTITPPSQLVVCSPSTLELIATCLTGNVVWSTGATSTSLTLNTVGTYTISAKCTLNGCDSDQSSVTNLEIKAKPSVPTITPPSQLVVCSPSTLQLTATCQTGNVVWSTGATTTSLTLNTVGTYAISAKCTLNDCDSDQSSTTNLEIKAKPSAPTVTPPTNTVVCSPNTLTLTATCTTVSVVWSNSSTGTSLTLNSVGTYSISAKCVSNGCESDASTPISLEIKAKPSVPTVTPPTQLVVCSPNTLTLTATCTSGSVIWSNSSTGTSLTLNAVGTYSISAKCVSNGCESDASTPISLEIKAKPNVPTVTPSTNTVVCSPNTLTLTATCTTGSIVWSNSSTGTSLTLNAVGTYSISAKCVSNGCESDASTPISLEIKAKPSVPMVTPPSELVVCSPNTLTLTATCTTGSVVWSNTSTGTSLTLNTVGTYSISAKCISNGCESDASTPISLEIKAKPSVPMVTPLANTVVCSPNTLTLTATCTTGSIVWSNSSTGTSLTLNAVGTYSISAKCVSNGCESDASVPVSLEIKALPLVSATNTGPYTVGQTISLIGGGIGTYAWLGPNNFSSTAVSPSIANALTVNGGIYTLTIVGVNGCVASNTTEVIVNGVNPCDPSRIVDYLYVKAGNPHQPLFNLTDGMTINQIPEQVSIIVTPSLCPSVVIESFEMNIQGPELNWNILQNVAPNALFDNSGTDIWGRNFKPGVYTLTVTGYAQDNKGGGITYGPKIIRFTVVGNLTTINAPTISKTSICAGSVVDVSFSTSGIFNSGNEFRVELSDSSGNFAAPVLIGTTNGIGTLSCTIPQNTVEGTKYLIRVASSNQVVVSNPAISQVTIHPYSHNLVSPTNNLTGTKTKKVVTSINASNKITSPASVTYQAGKSIVLSPGFESGAVFKAEIQGCEN